jgi:hypothetical protein
LYLLRAFALTTLTSLSLVLPATSVAQTAAPNAATGGAQFAPPVPPASPDPLSPVQMTVPGAVAKILPDGTAAAPALAPPQVQAAIWAANEIQDQPYVYGGGHKDFESNGYDCSGTVSYALHGGDLLDSPLDSSSFMHWGAAGPGQWITIYTNAGHAYTVIAGLRLDTSAVNVTRANVAGNKKALQNGPRWRPTMRSARGFKVRHPVGF